LSPIPTGENINGGVLTALSSNSTLTVPEITTFLPLTLNGGSEGVNSWFQGPDCGYEGLKAPPLNIWFSLQFAANTSWENQYWTEGVDLLLNVCLDPMTGTANYDGPNLSEIDFKPAAMDDQYALLYYGIGGQWEGGMENEPNIIEEYVGGIISSESMPWPYSVMKINNIAISRAATACGDQRDTIIAEYQQMYQWNKGEYPVQMAPSCEDFTQNHGTLYYSFNMLNTSDTQHGTGYTWAALRYPMMAPTTEYDYGLDQWALEIEQTASDPSIRNLNSAYRSPSVNEAVGGSFQPGRNSRHMFGDAVDLRNNQGHANDCNKDEAKQVGACCVPAADGGTCSGSAGAAVVEYTQLAAAAIDAQSGYVEPLFIKGKPSPCFLQCVHSDWRNKPGLYAQNVSN
jgi:hypothetical protein